MRTTVFPFISSCISLSASGASAHAGSRIIPSSRKNSSIVEQIRFSGQAIVWSLYFLHISKEIFPTLCTAAPSTKISIFSRAWFSHELRDACILGAHAGSAPMIFVFFPKISVVSIVHDITPHHPIGQIIMSGSFSIS